MSKYALGLLSGTSIDNIDVVLADFTETIPKIVAVHSHPFPGDLQQQLKQLASHEQDSNPKLCEIMRLHGELSLIFAAAVNHLLAQSDFPKEEICGIGFHGQTIGHSPSVELPWSLQIGDANRLSLLTGLPVVSNFRSMDIAAGGQGAPLAPLLHREIFNTKETATAVVNIGGIANLSLPDGGGFDTGPGNCLMDAWILQHKNLNYDNQGDWAASGTASDTLIDELLKDPYFQLAPPKSTGTDYFHLQWLSRNADLSAYDPADIQASLAELTARCIAFALETTNSAPISQLLVCGGGVHNNELMQRLQSILPNLKVSTTAVAGVDPDWVEGLLFAWLGWQRLHSQLVDTRDITGADRPLLLGAIFQAE